MPDNYLPRESARADEEFSNDHDNQIDNRSGNTRFEQVLTRYISRRQVLTGVPQLQRVSLRHLSPSPMGAPGMHRKIG